MKLNPDCIRAVMLEIEKTWELEIDDSGNIGLGNIPIEAMYQALPKYDKKDIFYSLYNLDQAGYIDLYVLWGDGGIAYCSTINHMTYAGHEFLDRIRDSKHWMTIKKGLDSVRGYSLDAISAVAEGVANAAIAAALKELGL